MARRYKIGVLKGDGIGPEVVSAAVEVLEALGFEAEYVELYGGYEYFVKTGKALQDDFFDIAKELDAILKGPLYTPPHEKEFRSVNVLLRRELDLYANVRPFKSYRGLSLKDFNFVIVRENTEDLYLGFEFFYKGVALAVKVVSLEGARRVAEFAFEYAKSNGFRRVTVVHKANILKVSDGLFREVFFEVARKHPELQADELIVDTAGYTIVKNPEKLGVLVTLNLYGDILADVAAAAVGSLGLCGSAQVGESTAVFEPVHGVALDIAGRGVANPVGELEAAKLMLLYLSSKHSDSSLFEKALKLEEAVHKAIEELNILTPDLGGSHRTKDLVDAIIRLLEAESELRIPEAA
uniref:Isocitrate/isopropylmalate dehydrogenase family protein n=1 Tax=Thermofilum pendens TaxID=2269 RepID=A0A7C1T1B1_THEPE